LASRHEIPPLIFPPGTLTADHSVSRKAKSSDFRIATGAATFILQKGVCAERFDRLANMGEN
jgi:hypothetical protein